MVDEGDEAPDFTVALADGGIEEFTLSENLDDAPIVLAFFPAAFTGVCTTEMSTFSDMQDDFEAAGGTVYGVSIDTPFVLNEFRDSEGISIGLLSDVNRELIDDYDVSMDFPDFCTYDVAKRSVFVVNGDGEVTYRWVTDDPEVEPDYDEVLDAVEEAA